MRSIWSVRAEVFVEDFGRAAQIGRRGWPRRRATRCGTCDSKSDGRTRRNAASNSDVESVGAGEEPDLRPFGLIGRREQHLPASEQDHGGRAVRDLRDERGAGAHLDRQVGAGDDEITNVELTRGVQRQRKSPATFETGSMRSMRQSFGSVLAGGGLSVDAPRRELGLDAALDEHFDEQQTPVAFEREPVAFLDHDPRGIGAGGVGELVDGGGVGVLDRQRQERRDGHSRRAPVPGARPVVDARRAATEAERRPRTNGGGESKARQRQQKPKGHRWSQY